MCIARCLTSKDERGLLHHDQRDPWPLKNPTSPEIAVVAGTIPTTMADTTTSAKIPKKCENIGCRDTEIYLR
jgi:hypothetical protein